MGANDAREQLRACQADAVNYEHTIAALQARLDTIAALAADRSSDSRVYLLATAAGISVELAAKLLGAAGQPAVSRTITGSDLPPALDGVDC